MKIRALALSLSIFALSSGVAMADPADLSKQIELLQQQIKTLQHELDQVKASQYKQAKQVAAVAARTQAAPAAPMTSAEASAAAADSTAGTSRSADGKTGSIFQNDKVKITAGGFIEAAGIYRSRSESADIASNWSGIPLGISSGNHLSEFRESARQSRLSLLAEGKPDKDTDLAAYFESDFLGAAPTANSNESNSYNPRLRQAYATYDRSDLGLEVLGGQAWSLLTLNKKGITERQENVPLTIDAQYVPGFTWTRNAQIRLVKEMDDNKIAAGLSLESPQTLVFNGPNTPTGGAAIYTLAGGSGFTSTNNYSTDLAPDVIAKLAFDPGYGHYELYGLSRFFRDRDHIGGSNQITAGGGVGAGAILPIIKKKLDFQLSGLAGKGIGRYGSAQLPDVTIKPDGSLATIGEVEALAGLTAHPDEKWDLYLYGGVEKSQKTDFYNGTGASHAYGYGSPLYDNSQCNIETANAPATHCVANTEAVAQVTAGAWWKFYKGSFGMMETGVQDSLTRRYVFNGVGGAPGVNENITMVSFRYYPF